MTSSLLKDITLILLNYQIVRLLDYPSIRLLDLKNSQDLMKDKWCVWNLSNIISCIISSNHILCNKPGPPPTMSGVKCQLSGVRCGNFFFFTNFKIFLLEGLLSTRPTPSLLFILLALLLYPICPIYSHKYRFYSLTIYISSCLNPFNFIFMQSYWLLRQCFFILSI